MGQHESYFFHRQYDGNPADMLDTLQTLDMADLHFQHIAIQEYQCIQGLRLRGGGNMFFYRQKIDIGRNALDTNIAWVPDLVKINIFPNPEPVSLLGSTAKMPPSANRRNQIHQSGCSRCCG